MEPLASRPSLNPPHSWSGWLAAVESRASARRSNESISLRLKSSSTETSVAASLDVGVLKLNFYNLGEAVKKSVEHVRVKVFAPAIFHDLKH